MPTRDIKHQVLLRKWAEIVHERIQSGLTVEDFCTQKQLSSKSYYRWQKLVRESVMMQLDPVAGESESKPVFAPVAASVNMPANQENHVLDIPEIIIRCGRFSVAVTAETSPDLLRRTLSVLQGL